MEDRLDMARVSRLVTTATAAMGPSGVEAKRWAQGEDKENFDPAVGAPSVRLRTPPPTLNPTTTRAASVTPVEGAAALGPNGARRSPLTDITPPRAGTGAGDDLVVNSLKDKPSQADFSFPALGREPKATSRGILKARQLR